MDKRVKICGIGSYLPHIVANEELSEIWGKVVKIACTLMDLNQRPMCLDVKTGKLLESNSDMAVKAALDALNNAEMEAQEVDLMIVGSSTPDYSLPALVNIVQDKLEIPKCTTLEIGSGGVGFMQGLMIASQFLRSNNKYNTALVIGSELNTRTFVPFVIQPDLVNHLRLGDLIIFASAADGAGAMVLKSTEDEDNIIEVCLGNAGVGKKAGVTYPSTWDSLFNEGASIVDKYKELISFNFDLTLRLAPIMGEMSIDDMLAATSLKVEEIDKFMIPVGSQEVIDKVTKKYNIPVEKVLTVASELGQIGNAMIPVTLVEMHKRNKLQADDKVFLQTGDISKWNYGAGLIRWPKLN